MPAMMLDYLGILVDANAAADTNLTVNLAFTDEDPYLLTMRSGVVLYERGTQAANADATLTLPRLGMFAILEGNEEEQRKSIVIEGDQDVIANLTEHLAEYDFFFNIVEPQSTGLAATPFAARPPAPIGRPTFRPPRSGCDVGYRSSGRP